MKHICHKKRAERNLRRFKIESIHRCLLPDNKGKKNIDLMIHKPRNTYRITPIYKINSNSAGIQKRKEIRKIYPSIKHNESERRFDSNSSSRLCDLNGDPITHRIPPRPRPRIARSKRD